MTGARTGLVWALAVLLAQYPFAVESAEFPGRTSRGIGFKKLERPLDDPTLVPGVQEEKPAPTIKLPPVTPIEPEEGHAPSRIGIYVKSFHVEGNTVLSPEEVGDVVAPFVGRINTSDDLQQLRYALTLQYINRGYITSGVMIPDQDVSDGIVTFQVIEGELSNIEVRGLKNLKPEYISERIRLGAGPPVNIVDLQNQLQIVNQDPIVKGIKSQLRPGTRLGESTMTVEVEENSPYRVDTSFNNYRPPSVGSKQGELYASTLNLTGRRDILELNYGFTDGLDDIALGYYLPLTPRDTTLGLYFERSDTTVVEHPFDDLDIDSKVTDVAISLRHPFYRTVNQTFSLTAQLEYERSKTFLLDEPFSFSPGVDEGKAEVSVVRLTADWLDRQPDQVFAVRSTFSRGIKAFGSTDNDGLPDSRFFVWLGQAQWIRRFGENGNQIVFRGDVQKANGSLLPVEQFVVGGHDTVRGYRENLLVRDSGWVTSLELRVPVLRNMIRATNIQVAAFSDYGKAWFEDFSTPSPKNISSAGLGLRFDSHDRVFGQIYWAIPFRNIDYNGSDLQDDGVHFNLTYRVM